MYVTIRNLIGNFAFFKFLNKTEFGNALVDIRVTKSSGPIVVDKQQFSIAVLNENFQNYVGCVKI